MTTAQQIVEPDWRVFDEFVRPARQTSWAAVDEWASALDTAFRPERERLISRRRFWNERLGVLKDPTCYDWRSFRPLRRAREEDWSDWLAQLIQDSETGVLGHALLGKYQPDIERSACCKPYVSREVTTEEGFRADLVIHWNDNSYTHLEVKVGDPALAKTLGTSRAIEQRNPGMTRRCDLVLLLPTQEEAWEQECGRLPGLRERVRAFTWLNVAIALRRSLVANPEESVRWKVWAHSFCGAIEQDLLDLMPGAPGDDWVVSLPPLQLRTLSNLLDVPDGTHDDDRF
jgi:hypothetical protein